MAEFAHLLESNPIYHLFESEFNYMLDNEKNAADLDPEMKYIEARKTILKDRISRPFFTFN